MPARLLLLVFTVLIGTDICAQKLDSLMIRRIFDEALTRGHSYDNLRELCKDVGHRLTGSEGAKKAEQWGANKMRSYGFKNVELQPFEAPYWVRGDVERGHLNNPHRVLNISALGGSVGTNGPLTAEVIEVSGTAQLEKMNPADIEGKWVFINAPMNPKLIDTFHAYGPCSRERWVGAAESARFGAAGVLLRSVTLRADDFPHTGVMGYNDTIPKIPAVAISTNDAHHLSNLLRKQKVTATVELNCEDRGTTTAHNVIGEIKGREHPEKIIVVGAHLDSWDIGEGAHDDGAGVVQALEVLRLFKAMEYGPRHTIRCVLYMNEENGAEGAKAYADRVKSKGEVHLAALESDRGGFTPRGFSVDARDDQREYLQQFKKLLEPYFLHLMEPGYSGVDVGFLRNGETTLIGFVPDSQRYFDVHHSANDVFEQVNKRELELGSASIAALIYLIDQYGLPQKVAP
ncbi:MAG: peptidase M28 family protein [Cryomorphaceae bacterium]|nr:MAG: peptidase M28 family protein [Cryomorphaceae bacterium]